MSSSVRVIECSKVGASFGSGLGGRWTCPVPSTTIEPGSSIQILKAYIHIPGSSEGQQQNLKITSTLTATIKFGYMSYFLSTLDIPDLNYWLVEPDDPTKVPPIGAPVYMHDDSGVLVEDVITLTLNPGVYSPGQIAENLTSQLRAVGGIARGFGIGMEGGQFNFKRVDVNFASYRGAVFIAGQDVLRFRTGSGQQYLEASNAPDTGSGDQIYFFGSDSATIAYNLNTQRFAISRLHTSIKDSQGAPVIVRMCTGAGAIYWYACQQSLLITDWGVAEADWDSSLWGALGFTWDDLNSNINNSKSNSGLGLSTADLPQPAMAGAADSTKSSEPSWFDVQQDTKLLSITGDEAQTNGPTASNPAALTAGAGGYWRVAADVGGNTWLTSGGARLPTVYGTADRSFASGDVYVGQEGPIFQVETVEPITVSEITISITTPLDGKEEVGAGPACSVLLAVYPPPQPPAPAQAERR